MANYFRESRDVELSLLYYLETQLANDWSNVTVLKSFKQVYTTSVDLPIVCVRLTDTSTTRRELGSNTLENRYLIHIDIFARSDAQRLDLSYYIKDKLKDGWVHYNHSHVSGDKTQLERTANGRDNVMDFVTDTKVEFFDSVDKKDRYRQSISIRVRKSS